MIASTVAPSLPITKQELFNEDNMKLLLEDEMFARTDRQLLSKYNKERSTGSIVNVTYTLKTGCDEFSLGRLYPTDGLSVGQRRFDLRNPLVAKYYFDTDIDNCHWSIAVKYCMENHLPHANALTLVTKRDEVLKLVSDNRKHAKSHLLKLLYLGNLHLYSELFDNVDGTLKVEGAEFLCQLQNEVKIMADRLWVQHPHLHPLIHKMAKKNPTHKKNVQATLMALLFQTVERDMLLTWDAVLQENGRTMDVYIHDGGLVRKLDGETEFPSTLLEQGTLVLQEKFKNPYISLSEKPIKYTWIAKSQSAYMTMKSTFEKHCCQIGAKIYDHAEEGHEVWYNRADAGNVYGHLQVDQMKKGTLQQVDFLNMWFKDATRRKYRRCDFIPDISKCPPTVFNTFTGFHAEKYRPKTPMTPEAIALQVGPILNHLRLISGGHGLYLCNYFGQIVQYPHIRSEITPVLRDMDGILALGGGTGKTTYIDWFGNEILGEKYYISVANNAELYASFNSQFEHKLLIHLEEANPKDNDANWNILKAMQTRKKVTINRKMVAQYDTNDYSRVICSSNNRKPMYPNRRNVFFDTMKDTKGDVEYHTKFHEHINKPETKWAFYQYLLNLDVYKTPAEFMENAPVTPAQIEITQLTASLMHKWILHHLKNGSLKDGYTKTLYDDYCQWMEKYREHGIKESLTSFGLKLNEEGISVNKTPSHGKVMCVWNIDVVVDAFKKQYLLLGDFVYIDNINDGTCKIQLGLTDDEDSGSDVECIEV